MEEYIHRMEAADIGKDTPRYITRNRSEEEEAEEHEIESTIEMRGNGKIHETSIDGGNADLGMDGVMTTNGMGAVEAPMGVGEWEVELLATTADWVTVSGPITGKIAETTFEADQIQGTIIKKPRKHYTWDTGNTVDVQGTTTWDNDQYQCWLESERKTGGWIYIFSMPNFILDQYEPTEVQEVDGVWVAIAEQQANTRWIKQGKHWTEDKDSWLYRKRRWTKPACEEWGIEITFVLGKDQNTEEIKWELLIEYEIC
jgi:hypothetical protein